MIIKTQKNNQIAQGHKLWKTNRQTQNSKTKFRNRSKVYPPLVKEAKDRRLEALI